MEQKFTRKTIKRNRLNNNKIFIYLLVIFLIALFFYYINANKKDLKTNTLIIDNKINTQNIDSFSGKRVEILNKTTKNTITDTKKMLIDKPVQNNIYDFNKDSSIQKFVSPKNHFEDIKYEPNDLLDIKSKYIVNSKLGMKLRKEALENLDLLAKDFYTEFKTSIILVSTYRNYDYQKGIEINNQECIKDNLCAKAGYSEHQTGLAVDIFEASSKDEFLSNKNYKKYFEWMQKNAYKYGFHNSYQNGIKIDGYDIEPWHWRYLGKDLAKKLNDENITFSQYHNNINK